MVDQTAVDFADFVKKHTEALKQYVVAVADEDGDSNGQIGSGVSVNINGRHFVGTAAHCIQNKPKVIHRNFFAETHGATGKIRFGTDKPIPILNRGWHPTLDIGFLEISETPTLEITESQLDSPVTIGGTIHIIGYPACMIQWDNARNTVDLHKVPFGTNIIEIADDFLKLDYPIIGKRAENGEWVDEPFPKTPHGFSGAGCFGVNQTINRRLRGLEIIEYKLVGIQCEWHKTERWVKARVHAFKFPLVDIRIGFFPASRRSRPLADAYNARFPSSPSVFLSSDSAIRRRIPKLA